MKWPTESLGNICDVISGGTPKRTVDEYWNGEIPWVKISDMLQGEIKYTDESITDKGLRESPARLLEPGTLLLSIFATVGRTAVLAIPAATNQAIVGLRIKTENLDQRYLRHYLDGQAQALKSQSRGVAQDNINTSILKSLKIPLPPLEEQRRIAAILDKGESIKALYTQRDKAFLYVEEALFAALREGDNRGLTGKTYSLSDIFWFQEGPGVRNWQFTSSGVKLLNVGNITIDGKVDLRRSERHVSEEEAFGRYSHFLVGEGDLLMPSSGIPIEGDGLLRTRSAFATSSDLPLCMNTSTIRFKPKTEEASLLFLQGWLQSREFRVQITKLVTGSAQKNFGPSHLRQLTITIPHPSLQDDFGKRLMRIRELRHSLRPSESNLSELMTSLGNLAFKSGASA
jgi:type I restriction enzyme S subunit